MGWEVISNFGRWDGVFLIILFIHLSTKNRPSALIAIFFLMGSQVVNAVFHVFFSFYYSDFSPGAITATLLYLPLNYFIIKAAFNEGFLRNKIEVILLFFLGCATFTLFEMFGPAVLAISTLFCAFYYVWVGDDKFLVCFNNASFFFECFHIF